MTAFTSRTLARHASLWDLAAIWVTLTATFAYLEVPLVNAPLFATALVLQAALGTVVITRLLRGAQPSLLMLLGPGLILGGALSFAIFQVVGRGIVGVVASTLAGLGSAGLLVRSLAPETNAEPRWWMLGQLVGMGMLTLAPEFAELLPVALVFFFLGFFSNSQRRRSGWLTLPTILTGAAVLAAAALLRSEYWWLVTDDYLMLEVIARHLAVEGPFAAWGVNSFASYHWLSYGWSGLLSLIGGSPAPLLTLSRVMPVVYSLSMAASLALTIRRLEPGTLTTTTTAFIWAVVAVGKFEWTGTSTGGVYAVLAAVVALALSTDVARMSPIRLTALVFAFSSVVVLTKLPSIFALMLSFLILLIELVTGQAGRSTLSRYLKTVGLTVSGPFVLLAVWIFGNNTEGRIRLTTTNPGLGQLAFTGRSFIAATLILNQLWLWTFVGIAVWQRIRAHRHTSLRSSWLVATSAVSLLCALVLEMSLSGATNTYTYFSGPLYFFASLSLLVVGSQIKTELIFRPLTLILTGTFVASGLLWNVSGVSSSFWNLLGQVLDIDNLTRIELLKFYTSDGRFGLVLLAAMMLAFFFTTGRTPTRTLVSLTLALTVVTMYELRHDFKDSYQTKVSSVEISSNLGSDSQREIGEWFRNNSDTRAVIGTNFLFDETGGSVSDYALAAWSQREFLVLGPQLGYGTTPARSEAFALSRSFANESSDLNCSRLVSRGVRWFLIDERLTLNRNWPKCAEQVYRVEHFVILKLSELG
jgi:hypothetical protein